MPRPRSFLESATARLRLPVQGKPYPGPTLARGIKLMYRRNKNGAGSWVVRAANGIGTYWTNAFATADDFDPADGATVLNYGQAQDRAKQLARARNAHGGAAVNVLELIDRFEHDLVELRRRVVELQREAADRATPVFHTDFTSRAGNRSTL